MRVALVHDWLNGMRGGERCLQAFLALYPEADIFTLFHEPGTTSAEIDRRVKEVSFLQRIPGARRGYRFLLPLYPLAIRRFNFSGYDLVISLSHAAAKNVVIPVGTIHLCYCFTPMRYIWDQARAYFGGRLAFLWPLISWLRRWDIEGSEGVDQFVGISRFVAARIRCFYGRDAEVIYPPVDVGWVGAKEPFEPASLSRGEAFLCAGALVPYKRVAAIIEAFNGLGETLWVVGSGPEEERLREIAGSNIKFFGQVTDSQLAELYRRCRALVFAGKEDFGMMPVECMAAGRPVIGLYAGGLKESVRAVRPWAAQLTEIDFAQASGVAIRPDRRLLVQHIQESVRFFIQHEQRFSAAACVRQAAEFSPERFFAEWSKLVSEVTLESKGSREVGVGAHA